MGAESPRSFSAFITAECAKFVSYREAMTTLMKYTGEPLADIARALKQKRIHKSHVAYLAGPEQAVTKITSSDALEALLDETIRSGRIAAANCQFEGETATPDLDGWLRREFTHAMVMAGLPCPDTPDILAAVEERRAKQASESEPTLEWTRPYISRGRISLGDAATILAGLSPAETSYRSDEEYSKIGQWRTTLIDVIGDDNGGWRLDEPEISASQWDSDRDREQMLSHADLRAWCRKWRHPWPIPDPSPQPATNADALAEIDRLRAVEAESVELRRHLDTAIASLANANARLAKLDPSADVLAEVRNLRDEIGRLKELAPPRPEFLIPIVVAVQKQFWADWDESKPRPKAEEEIQPWIKASFPQISDSNALVQAVEKVACPFNRNPSAKR